MRAKLTGQYKPFWIYVNLNILISIHKEHERQCYHALHGFEMILRHLFQFSITRLHLSNKAPMKCVVHQDSVSGKRLFVISVL